MATINARFVKQSRKLFFCTDCSKPIRIGAPHIRLYGSPDNEKPYQLRFHPKCAYMLKPSSESFRMAVLAAQEHEKEYGSQPETV